jgi:hypothetical protein
VKRQGFYGDVKRKPKAEVKPTELDKQALEAIEEAIWEGAREWDAMALPRSEEPAKKAWAKIKELLK